jgi:nucleotide-binding universal stress UspA family protein
VFSDILVPTDGSDASLVAVDQGIAIARRFDATVHFLHVVDVGVEMSASAVGDIADDLTATLEDVAEDALDAAEAWAEDAGVSYERTILEGDPHEAILDYSTDHDIDLIVLGESGRSGLEEHLLGSTTDRVAQSAEISVLIARP